MIHNHGSCGSSLMGKTSLRSVCLIFTHQTQQNVKIRQAFRSHIYTHENRRARSGLGPFFLRVTSLTSLISLTNLDGGDKSERRTFLNILLNSSKYCKEILQVYFNNYSIILQVYLNNYSRLFCMPESRNEQSALDSIILARLHSNSVRGWGLQL